MTSIACTLCILVIITSMVCHDFVDGWSYNRTYHAPHKGTIKTISRPDGNIIDCVDSYRQLAFKHPLLKNHKIQLESSSRPSGIRTNASLPELWHRSGEACPQGSIPRKRAISSPNLPRKTRFHENLVNEDKHEYAVVSQDGPLHGVKGVLNVWNPTTMFDEMSASKIRVSTWHDSGLDSIESGWEINPGYYGDSKTSFFIRWTSDNYKKGCLNLDCPGFVQTSPDDVVGTPINPVSSFGGKQYGIEIHIVQDSITRDWWIILQGKTLGYYPASIFTILSEGAMRIDWGGDVLNLNPDGHHTATQMGSGHFPSEGPPDICYIKNLQVMDEPDRFFDPTDLYVTVTNPSCYNLQMGPGKTTYGVHFYFGGPGFSSYCQ